MEILYVSSVPSPKEFDRIKENIKPGVNITTYGMNESGFKFHTLILDGICSRENVNVTSVVGRSVGRSTHNGVLWKRRDEKTKDNLIYKHLSFFNLPLIKQLGLAISVFFHTIKWGIKNRKKERGIIMDASYVTVLPSVFLASKLTKSKTTAIFCDIYDYMADVKDAFEKKKVSLTRRILRSVSTACYRNLSSYVFLTEQMNPLINTKGKPYIVMEGLVDVNMEQSENTLEGKEERMVVMYAGALREVYGVKSLIEGFNACNTLSSELWIFGDGDYRDEVKKAAEKNDNIKFFGAVPLSQVVSTELKATLMVNPRPIGHQFTAYSFPSKNMEYMVSGTPILTTRLPGMPADYYDYIYTIDGDGSEYIEDALKKVLSLSREELHEKGRRAKEFVLKEKNNITQSERILGLFK